MIVRLFKYSREIVLLQESSKYGLKLHGNLTKRASSRFVEIKFANARVEIINYT